MNHARLSLPTLVVLALAEPPTGPWAQTTRKLSGPLTPSPSGIVEAFQLHPDGQHAIAVVGPGSGGPKRIESWRIDGTGSPVLLFEQSTPWPVLPFKVVEDGSRLLFIQHDSQTAPLYSTNLDGSGVPVCLTPGLVTGGYVLFQEYVGSGPWITNDNQRVVYLARAEVSSRELFSVPVDGSALPSRIHAPLAASAYVESAVLSPDGSQVLFVVADSPTSAVRTLHVASTDGSGAPLRLDAPTVTTPTVARPVFTQDGAYAVYGGVQTTEGRFDLHVVPVDGSAPPSVLASGPTFGGHFEAGNDGEHVLFVGGTNGKRLWSVPQDGSAPALELSGPMVSGGGLGSGNDDRIFQSPDGAWIAFVADKETRSLNELYVVPVDGSSAARKLSGPLGTAGNVGPDSFPATDDAHLFDAVEFTPDGTRVLYIADATVYQVNELFSVPVDGSSAPVPVSEVPFGLRSGVEYLLRFSPDGERVVFRGAQFAHEVVELWSAPVDGSAAPVRLNTLPVPGGDVLGGLRSNFDLTADGNVVYLADQDVNGTPELFAAPLQGGSVPVRLNPSFPAGEVEGDVETTQVSPDGHHAVYTLREQRAEIVELYSASLESASPPVKLSHEFVVEGGVTNFLITPDSTLVVYRVQHATTGFAGASEVYCVPIDGSTVPWLVSGTKHSVQGFSIDPTGSRVLFIDGKAFSHQQLYSAPLDASSTPVELSGLSGASSDQVRSTSFTPDGLKVLFVRVSSFAELHVAPIDGLAPAQKIAPQSDVRGYRLSSDGTFAIFAAYLALEDRTELFRVNLDGSGLIRLSDLALTGGANRDIWTDIALTPDDQFAVYRADRDADEVFELYCVPSDGSTLPVELNLPLEGYSNRDVLDFAVSPDSQRVIYRSNQDYPGWHELFSASVSGGVPRRLHARATVNGDYEVSPAGRVVFFGSDANEELGLWSSPIDAGTPQVLLSGGRIRDIRLRGNGERFLFRRYPLHDPSTLELLCVPIDGSHGPFRINEALPTERQVAAFATNASGGPVVFIADQETDDVNELFLSVRGSGPHKGQAATPTTPVRTVLR